MKCPQCKARAKAIDTGIKLREKDRYEQHEIHSPEGFAFFQGA